MRIMLFPTLRLHDTRELWGSDGTSEPQESGAQGPWLGFIEVAWREISELKKMRGFEHLSI